MPLLLHRRALKDLGLSVKLFTRNTPELCDCDVLGIDGKYHTPLWASQRKAVLEEVSTLSERAGSTVFFDIVDSATWDQAHILPFVDLYCKSQMLVDKSHYMRPLYGTRLFTDYYHRHNNVRDTQAESSIPVLDKSLLSKLTLGWNSGLADYSYSGPFRMALFEKLPLHPLLRFPGPRTPATAPRRRDASLRIGTTYPRHTVAHQRKELVSLLNGRIPANKLSRLSYLNELSQSKVVVSPFGLGEITLRDFETFSAGALLLKPDMSHMQTWPNFFERDQTMISHRWDLSDFDEVLAHAIENHHEYLDIANQAQKRYHSYVSGPQAGSLFAAHFNEIVQKAITARRHTNPV